MSNGSILLVVPARGGSKGVPGKNLFTLAGAPLITHVLRAAREAARRLPHPARLLISTDDAEIADTARRWGAEVPFLRPPALARDDSPIVEVLLHALEALRGQEGFDPSAVVLLQPTSPLVGAEDIVDAVGMFFEGGIPVVSVTPNEHPLEWSFHLEGGRLKEVKQGARPARRQESRATYRLNGAVYVTSPARLRTERSFITADTRAYFMPAERSVDIDGLADFRLAETLLSDAASNSSRREIEVAGRRIGPGHPCFVIAEAGVNHNGDIGVAHRLIDVAAEAGADAVKFQTFAADRLATADAPKAEYQKATTGADESQLEMLRRLELKPEQHFELLRHAAERGLIFLSTPFEETSADLLETLGIAAFKVPSGEVTNTPFLIHLARKGRPLLLSTGMSTLEEVDGAVRAVRENGDPPLALLHCVSCYPAAAADCNLRALETLRRNFGVPVGFSDHTLGTHVSTAAVALGANLIERHFTLDRTLPGPDHRASSEPAELAALIRGVREVESALGDGVKRRIASEEGTAAVARKSLVAVVDIPAGVRLEPAMFETKRPGTGVAPHRLWTLAGRRAQRTLERGAILQEDDFA